MRRARRRVARIRTLLRERELLAAHGGADAAAAEAIAEPAPIAAAAGMPDEAGAPDGDADAPDNATDSGAPDAGEGAADAGESGDGEEERG